MPISSPSILKYFPFFNFHNPTEAISAVETFKETFIPPFASLISEYFLEKNNIVITVSDSDLLDTLHQIKHEIEGFAHLYLVESPTLHYSNDKLPKMFLEEYSKVPSNGTGYGLIANVLTPNEFRQAACYMYWITKLKPILQIEIENEEKLSSKTVHTFQTYINEFFAIFIAFGRIRSANDISRGNLIKTDDLDTFLHLLRYKQANPESLALLLHLWFSKLVK